MIGSQIVIVYQSIILITVQTVFGGNHAQKSPKFFVAGRNDAILSSFDEIEDFGELWLQFICHDFESRLFPILQDLKLIYAQNLRVITDLS
jgi:hypothetical protein